MCLLVDACLGPCLADGRRGGQATQPPPSYEESTHVQDVETALRQRIVEQLRAGRTVEALRTAQRSVAEHPGDSAVREEVISFCLSLARRKMGEENFTVAERALPAVLKIDVNHPEARRLTKAIRTTQTSIAQRFTAVLSAYAGLGMMIQAGKAETNKRDIAKLFEFRSA